MMTFRQLAAGQGSIPTAVAWYLSDLGEARGKQELFTHQSPQKLKVLREHALIESAVSSSRIEGVVVDEARIGTLVFGKPLLRDRDEEELRGYRDALRLVHEHGAALAISEDTILRLHGLVRGKIADAGQYKERDSDIIETYADGRRRVRFKTVPAAHTPGAMAELLEMWSACLQERWVPPLVALAAFNLDFLAIHPFRDGNGRVSRLLLLLQCYHLGCEVGRYISLERLIEHDKERYYETLEQSSGQWHDAKHDPWPYVNYVLYILKTAYREFEERLGQVAAPRGAKTQMVIDAIHKAPNTFRISELQRACPAVSIDLVRRTLRKLREAGQVECLGTGRSARWRKTGN